MIKLSSVVVSQRSLRSAEFLSCALGGQAGSDFVFCFAETGDGRADPRSKESFSGCNSRVAFHPHFSCMNDKMPILTGQMATAITPGDINEEGEIADGGPDPSGT
jgi:hypothetical protein